MERGQALDLARKHVSKESNLKSAYMELRKAEAKQVKTIPMGQGNKISRIAAWTFLTPELQKKWVKDRWNTNQ
jgi:23S rRNA (adenine1618-N6)-methyltransferase